MASPIAFVPFFMAIGLALATPLSAQQIAADAPRLAAAKSLAEVQYAPADTAMQFKQLLEDLPGPPRSTEYIDLKMKTFLQNQSKMLERLTDHYAKTFTTEELLELLKFYSSSLSKKFRAEEARFWTSVARNASQGDLDNPPTDAPPR